MQQQTMYVIVEQKYVAANSSWDVRFRAPKWVSSKQSTPYSVDTHAASSPMSLSEEELVGFGQCIPLYFARPLVRRASWDRFMVAGSEGHHFHHCGSLPRQLDAQLTAGQQQHSQPWNSDW